MSRIPLWALVATIVGCAGTPGADGNSPSTATFVANEYSFTGPEQIPAGAVRFVLQNQGRELHHAILVELTDSTKSIEDLLAWDETRGTPEWITVRGGAGPAAPGDSTVTLSDLPEGRYVVICFIPNSAGTPHSRMGMARPLTVGPDSGPPLSPPSTDGIIELKENAIVFLPPLAAGRQTIRVHNSGEQVHDLFLVRLDDDATVEAFLSGLAPDAQGPPPGRLMNSIGALSPGLDAWFTVDLAPGRYVALCMVPDSSDGAPHFAHGMMHTFTVE